MPGEDWTDEENTLIVRDYLDMLRSELAGRRYNKAEHNRELQLVLASRSRGSIEFKHQNISAVMLGLGQPWIDGYKPASQFQSSLVDAVLRQLPDGETWTRDVSGERGGRAMLASGVRDPSSLWVGPPPTHSNEPPPVDAERMAIIAKKYDVAARDERNRKLGDDGEEYALDYERFRLRHNGRSDLADRVVWTSKLEGDGAGFDISSFEADGASRLLEVKTTNGWHRTPFHISKNELHVAEASRESWVLFRIYEFARSPKAFELRPPLEEHVELTATSFKASLK